jgi:hypothetical protein
MRRSEAQRNLLRDPRVRRWSRDLHGASQWCKNEEDGDAETRRLLWALR